MRGSVAVAAVDDAVIRFWKRGLPAVDFRQNRFHVRIARFVFGIPPVQRPQRLIHGIGGRIGPGFQTFGELMNKPGVTARVSGRLNRFFAPLQQALRVRKRALFLRVSGGRKEKDLCRDILRGQFAALDFRRVVPERSGFDFHHVAHDEPFQFGQGLPFQTRMLSADRRVLPHDKQPVDFAVRHFAEIGEVRMIARDARQPAEAPVVFPARFPPIIGLEQADQVGRHLRPEPGLSRVVFQVSGKGLFVVADLGHRHVTGQNVVERRNVGRSLDGRMAAQGQDAAAGPPDVAQEQLQDGGGADDLNAFRMLGPTDRITNRGGLLRTRGGRECFGYPLKEIRRNAAHLFHHLRCVAAEVTFQDLKDRPRMPQRRIPPRMAEVVAFVEPRGCLVAAFILVPTGKETVEFFGVAVVFAQQAGGIGEVHHVVTEEDFPLEHKTNEPAQKRQVAPGSDRHPDVGQRAGAGETRVHMDHRRALFFGVHDPAKTHRVRLGHGRALDQDAVGVRQILLGGGGATAAERGAQTGHRAGMSYPRLVRNRHHPQAGGEQLFDQVIFLVVQCGAAQMRDGGCVVDRATVFIPHKGSTACFPNAIRHHVHRSIQIQVLPVAPAGGTIADARQAVRLGKQVGSWQRLWDRASPG